MTQIFGIHSIDSLHMSTVSSLYVASDPVGAQIYLDDIEQTGFHTPSMITNIPPGHHNIKLISPGYIDIESSMPLESGRTYNIFLTMMRSQDQAQASSAGVVILLAIGLGLLLFRKSK